MTTLIRPRLYTLITLGPALLILGLALLYLVLVITTATSRYSRRNVQPTPRSDHGESRWLAAIRL